MQLPHDPRYLLGIRHFNRAEYFEAHEVWEDLWRHCAADERRFYLSLIQAAVALYHNRRGNESGARRLFLSGRSYMEPYRPRYHGLAVDAFWTAVEAQLFSTSPSVQDNMILTLDEESSERVELNPPPLLDPPWGRS